MKKIITSFLLLVGSISAVQAQDCSGFRYQEPIFTAVTSTLDVQYGSNVAQNGTTVVDLKMDVYQPTGDVFTERPVIVMAHGGSFMGGSKDDMASACSDLAKLGYVAVSIQYRLLSVDAAVIMNPGLEFQKEVVRAMHDMKAAVRFLRKSAIDGGNPYGINPDLIIVGGSSAGAILANHVAYLDQASKVPATLTAYVNDQGGLEGNSGNSTYSSEPQLVISMCGAIMDTTWIEAGDQPFVGIHNVGDQVVPNLAGQPNIGMTIPVTLMGDSLIYTRTLTQNINSAYRSYPGNGHCDFPAESSEFIIDFVHDQICLTDLAIASNSETALISVYPNPASTSFYVDVPANKWNWAISIVNMTGQEIYSGTLSVNDVRINIESNAFEAGIYMVNLKAEDGKSVTKKVIVR